MGGAIGDVIMHNPQVNNTIVHVANIARIYSHYFRLMFTVLALFLTIAKINLELSIMIQLVHTINPTLGKSR